MDLKCWILYYAIISICFFGFFLCLSLLFMGPPESLIERYQNEMDFILKSFAIRLNAEIEREKMNVNEARNEAKGKELARVLANIKNVTTFGSETTLWPGSLRQDTVQELRDMGYEVEYFNADLSDGYDISWRPKAPKKAKKFLGLF